MLKRLFEKYLLLSRWLLAPLFVTLTLGLLALVVNGCERLWELFHVLITSNEERFTTKLLGLVDVTLTGALVVIVTISVYENFVSRVDSKEHEDWPDWMGNIDFSELKLRLLSTIVAISAIKLLEAFMNIPEMNDRDLYFYIGIHLTFVVSTLAFAIAERISTRGEQKDAPRSES